MVSVCIKFRVTARPADLSDHFLVMVQVDIIWYIADLPALRLFNL